MAPIEFYFDFISPYGYLGSTQVEALAARYGRTVDWKPVLLGITVMKVMGLKPLPETPLKKDYILIDKPRMATLLGVPLVEHGLKGVNSLAASRAFLWLKAQDPALAVRFAHRIYERLWVQGKDIMESVTMTSRGTLNFASEALQCASMRAVVSSGASSLSTTNATAISP